MVWARPNTDKISESGINVCLCGCPQYSPTLHLTLYVKLEPPLTFLCTEHSDWLRHSWLGLDQGKFLTNLQSWASIYVDLQLGFLLLHMSISNRKSWFHFGKNYWQRDNNFFGCLKICLFLFWLDSWFREFSLNAVLIIEIWSLKGRSCVGEPWRDGTNL